jgi:hypothetical protein
MESVVEPTYQLAVLKTWIFVSPNYRCRRNSPGIENCAQGQVIAINCPWEAVAKRLS